MKILISSLLLLTASLSMADVAVYNGSQVVKTTSLAGTTTVVEKFVEVVDLTGSQVVVITLGVNKGKKNFSVGLPATVVQTEVQDSRGAKRKSLVLAQAGTTTDVVTGITTVSSFLQTGGQLQVSIRTGVKVGLPRNMHGSSTVVSTTNTDGGAPVAPEYVDVKSVLVLQEVPSRLSNDANDTLAAAVDRLKATLLAKGYVDADA